MSGTVICMDSSSALSIDVEFVALLDSVALELNETRVSFIALKTRALQVQYCIRILGGSHYNHSAISVLPKGQQLRAVPRKGNRNSRKAMGTRVFPHVVIHVHL